MIFKPNQSGTFGNRVNFHDAVTEEKLFAIEFHTDDLELRKSIVNDIRVMNECVDACKQIMQVYKEKGQLLAFNVSIAERVIEPLSTLQ